MMYALQSGDTDGAAELIVPLGFALYRDGRMATVRRWLDPFDDDEQLRRYPDVAILGALVHALDGHAFRAQRWLDIAERAIEAGDPEGDGDLRGRVSTVRAMFCAAGPERMEEDAAFALRELEPHNPLQPVAAGLHATALWLQGDSGRA